jgi:tetratricopeptide (TPR) repeat protein
MMPGQTIEQMWLKARNLQARGKLSQAWKLMRDARKAAPRVAGLALETGVLEAQMGRLDQAIATLREAVKLDGKMADAHFNLAEALRAKGLHADAAGHYRSTLELDPSYAEAHLGLGSAMLSAGQREQALPHLKAAAAAMPQDIEAQTVYGAALLETDTPSEGLKVLAALAAQHPADVSVAMEFLRALNAHGRANQVTRHIRFMQANLDLKQLIARFDTPGPADVARLQTLADGLQAAGEPDLAGEIAQRFLKRRETRSRGALLKGTLAVQAGDFDSAQEHLEQVLALTPGSSPAMQQLAIINRLPLEAEQKLQDILDGKTGASDSDRIMAGSALYRLLSRNGKPAEGFAALTRAQALRAAAHPYDPDSVEQLNRANETVFTPAFFEARGQQGCMGDGCIFIVGMMRSGTTLTEQILAAHSQVHAGGERNDMMDIVEMLGHDLGRINSLPADWASKVGEQLHAAMFKDAGQASFATDKLPGNIDYVGLIRLFLPRAKFIYTHRTPQDCALSNFEQMFASSVRFSFDLKALAHKYAWHEDIARYWIEDCKLDVYDLDYEMLVNDPEPNIRKLLGFCGLPFEENCLYPNEVKREIRTASVFQVRQPISAKSVGRWQKYEAQMQAFTDELERQRAIIATRKRGN